MLQHPTDSLSDLIGISDLGKVDPTTVQRASVIGGEASDVDSEVWEAAADAVRPGDCFRHS